MLNPQHLIPRSQNTTKLNFHEALELYLTYPTGRQNPLNPPGVTACVAAASTQAAAAGRNKPFPRLGYQTNQGRVWLQVYPRNRGFTWGLMAATVLQAEEALRNRGFFECDFEISSAEQGGRDKSLFAWGRMSPTLGEQRMGEE
ncbi:MAG: hypothetical protein Q9219_001184 [cf. Caloplaca sp. 3 TL-2023]